MINHSKDEVLTQLTADKLRQARLNLEPLLRRWSKLSPDDQDRYIATEIMGWTIGRGKHVGCYVYEEKVVPFEEFQPSVCLRTAYNLFESFLIPDQISIQPCGSASGLFWMVYFKDAYIGVGKTLQQALCNACIVIKHAAASLDKEPVQRFFLSR